MYRSGFERVCDVIASVQNALGEGLQWAVTALFFGGAITLILGSMSGS
ncbi:MAG: hypothetical protein KF889_14870 [Alphaproteobacteria bacterium]|nr:hypothetical protein [Alphaproteobacteria bacterium]MCW5743681.1 hypothetical protein [Alphaproteobacteria bacterium]